MSYIAPAGTRLTLAEVGKGLVRGWTDAKASDRLSGDLRQVSGSNRVWPVVSGRAAMTVALRAMARVAGPERRRVILPAYTCYSVPAAVERAGLVPVPCDIDPGSLSLDLDHMRQLHTGDVLAVTTANLFGIPNDLVEIEKLARQLGIFMLDDAAQALGARVAGKPVGGYGDMGLFSFDKGKNISTMQGGALLAQAGPLLEAAEREWAHLANAGFAACAASTAQLLPYAVFLRPPLYGLIHRMPLLALGETRYETDYSVTRMCRGLVGVALVQLEQLERYRATRNANAEALRAALEGTADIRFVGLPADSEPAYPRFPVRINSRARRDQLRRTLDRHGIGATSFYPSALVDVPQVARLMPTSAHGFPGAREVAGTLLTLPTHAHCPADLPGRIRRIVAADR
jgi:perosamine synthetase